MTTLRNHSAQSPPITCGALGEVSQNVLLAAAYKCRVGPEWVPAVRVGWPKGPLTFFHKIKDTFHFHQQLC